MTKTMALLASALLLSGCATVAEETATTSPGAMLEQMVPQLIADEKVAGIGIAMIEDGKVRDSWYFGEQEPGRPVDAKTVFNTASVAKTVISELYIDLDDRQYIDLDAPIAERISHDDLAGDPRFAALTPRILLAHTSGLRNWPHQYEDGKLAFDFAPGEKFGYSGAGIEMAAQYAAASLGATYRDLAWEYVLGPADVEQMSLGAIEPWMEGHLARPMGYDGQWSSIAETNSNLSSGQSDSAADDLLVTVPAYGRFLEWVIADRENHAMRRDIRSSVLDEGNYRCREEVTAVCPQAAGHSLGWQVNNYGNHDVVFHSGSDSGENALVYFSPDTRDGAVIFVNGANGWVPMVRIVEVLGQEPEFADYLRGIIADLMNRPLEPLASTDR
ncbi:serine hydrolase domain-containing protein [Sphingomicrobium arenosum]|uniref:serine hydrolase domain-containing protein n=1 Tax=Sphingomicrobium arenosum TaxID=2233861 RepID=UPI0022410220|nr:serine hydrolase domain-containing protein [Sphingomicrobium arenosum]